MDGFTDYVVPALAVGGFGLSVWNFWMSHWGKVPARRAEIRHLDGRRFALDNTGRRQMLITKPEAVGTAEAWVEGFESVTLLRPNATKVFTLSPLIYHHEYPSVLQMFDVLTGKNEPLTVRMPSLSADILAQLKESPPELRH